MDALTPAIGVGARGADLVDGRRVARALGSAPAERAIERIECPVEVVRDESAPSLRQSCSIGRERSEEHEAERR